MSSAKKAMAPKKKGVVSSHPPFADMIKECIVAHPSEARSGVSRPTIKKFLETRYGLDISPSTITSINRAITNGAEKGVFALPKGPSGKVKLAPKVRDKENAAPAPAPVKAKTVKKPKGTEKSKTSKPAARSVKKTSASASRTKKAVTAVKRPSTAKKTATPTKKPVAKTVKKSTAVKKSTKPTSAKKTAAKRAPVKKTLVGSAGSKAKSSASKAKSATKKATSSAKRKAPTKRG